MDYIYFGAIVLAFTQMFKVFLSPNSRWIPVLSVGIALVLLVTLALLESIPITWQMLANALTSAFVANGLWSGVKTTVKG